MNEPRVIDANINRAAEGLRVLEDIVRFKFDNARISSSLRKMRHRIRKLFKTHEKNLLFSRDAVQDVGIQTSALSDQDRKSDIKESLVSNCKRVQEALRTLEEMLKAGGEYQCGKEIEQLRFRIYDLEPQMMRLFIQDLPNGIYGILARKFSRGRSNIEVARQMVDAGIDILQYREKLNDTSLKQIYTECCEIRKITRDAHVPFIVNDYADIALMVEADGVHMGQDDLPVSELRKISRDLMIGVSTHSPEQAEKAMESGADYIGVGPIFETHTKTDVCDPVGLGYLEYAVRQVPIPFVAIGGIKLNNLEAVLSRGAKTVCLVTEIVGSDNIGQTIQAIRNRINKTKDLSAC